MSNECNYSLRAVSKDKDALERFVSIMKGTDSEFCLYWCYGGDTNADEIKSTDDGSYFYVDIDGQNRCSCGPWFNIDEDTCSENKVIGYEKDERGHEDWNKPIYGTAHYATIMTITETLGISLELWVDEPYLQFEEHAIVNKSGFDFDRIDYDLEEQESTDEYRTMICVNGHKNFGEYMPPNELISYKCVRGYKPTKKLHENE